MISFKNFIEEKKGLWDNIHAKRKRIAAGSGERMRKPGSKGAPTKQNFIDAQEATQPKTPHEKFKAGLKRAGYDPDAGAKRLLDLIAKQKKEREEREQKNNDMKENFMDGRNPENKGDMSRHGLKGKSISQLKSIRSSDNASPRKKQLAHWYINMHKGK